MPSNKPCDCGSGLPRRANHDTRGYFLTFSCDKCRKRKLRRFRPEVLTDSQYEADDLGDDEEALIEEGRDRWREILPDPDYRRDAKRNGDFDE